MNKIISNLSLGMVLTLSISNVYAQCESIEEKDCSVFCQMDKRMIYIKEYPEQIEEDLKLTKLNEKNYDILLKTSVGMSFRLLPLYGQGINKNSEYKVIKNNYEKTIANYNSLLEKEALKECVFNNQPFLFPSEKKYFENKEYMKYRSEKPIKQLEHLLKSEEQFNEHKEKFQQLFPIISQKEKFRDKTLTAKDCAYLYIFFYESVVDELITEINLKCEK